MRSFWESTSASSPSSSSGDEVDMVEPAPTQLLSMAIKKRRALYESKDRDFRKELLHTGMIQTLCKFLGEGRACRKNKRASRKRKSSQSLSQATKDLPQKYAISNDDLEPMDDDQRKNPDPTMLELNGMDDGDDAVVPVMKRSKYEQVFVPPPPPPPEPAEPTEQEKEIIKEYVFEDFMSSFVSFYTPNEFYTNGDSSVEPTKDLYWCCVDDTGTTPCELMSELDELEHIPFFGSAAMPNHDNTFEFLAMC